MRRFFIGIGILVLLGIVMGAAPASALVVPPAPSLETPIVDQTNTLSPAAIQQLSDQIAASRQQKSYQIGILIIPTLGNGEYLEGYALKVARDWGIGEQGKNNGVLILVVKNDHKMRIEVGSGLEGDLTDVRASRIIREVMTPAFRQDDFAGGLSKAITSIQNAVSGQADPNLGARSSTKTSLPWGDLADAAFFILFFGIGIISWVMSMLARSKSWWAGGVIGGVLGAISLFATSGAWWSFVVFVAAIIGGLLLDFSVSRNYKQHKDNGTLPSWWAGGGSIGGGSGGGFSGGGFGGGGFSGGGSSGSW